MCEIKRVRWMVLNNMIRTGYSEKIVTSKEDSMLIFSRYQLFNRLEKRVGFNV